MHIPSPIHSIQFNCFYNEISVSKHNNIVSVHIHDFFYLHCTRRTSSFSHLDTFYWISTNPQYNNTMYNNNPNGNHNNNTKNHTDFQHLFSETLKMRVLSLVLSTVQCINPLGRNLVPWLVCERKSDHRVPHYPR